MDQLVDLVWTFVQLHILTINNLYLCGLTYALIWVMELPVRKLIESLPREKQLLWWERQKTWKNFAALLWCCALIWIPFDGTTTLCGEEMVDGCQTPWGKIATAAMLGVVLSLAHKFVFAKLKKLFGVRTKEPREVTLSKLSP